MARSWPAPKWWTRSRRYARAIAWAMCSRWLRRRGRSRCKCLSKAGAVVQHMADQHALFAVLCELGPVARDRRVQRIVKSPGLRAVRQAGCDCPDSLPGGLLLPLSEPAGAEGSEVWINGEKDWIAPTAAAATGVRPPTSRGVRDSGWLTWRPSAEPVPARRP